MCSKQLPGDEAAAAAWVVVEMKRSSGSFQEGLWRKGRDLELPALFPHTTSKLRRGARPFASHADATTPDLESRRISAASAERAASERRQSAAPRGTKCRERVGAALGGRWWKRTRRCRRRNTGRSGVGGGGGEWEGRGGAVDL
jgi:hypothetical protein